MSTRPKYYLPSNKGHFPTPEDSDCRESADVGRLLSDNKETEHSKIEVLTAKLEQVEIAHMQETRKLIEEFHKQEQKT